MVEYRWYEMFEGQGSWLQHVIPHAYKNCKELQSTSYLETLERISESTAENDRLELVCFRDSKVVAVAVVVLDNDDHVGDCIGVQWNYSRDVTVNTGFTLKLFRKLKELSRERKIPYAYTKRIGEGKYQLTFKEY